LNCQHGRWILSRRYLMHLFNGLADFWLDSFYSFWMGKSITDSWISSDIYLTVNYGVLKCYLGMNLMEIMAPWHNQLASKIHLKIIDSNLSTLSGFTIILFCFYIVIITCMFWKKNKKSTILFNLQTSLNEANYSLVLDKMCSGHNSSWF